MDKKIPEVGSDYNSVERDQNLFKSNNSLTKNHSQLASLRQMSFENVLKPTEQLVHQNRVVPVPGIPENRIF